MQKGFLASLFDVSFASLVAPRIVRPLYTVLLTVFTLGSVAVLLGTLGGDASPAQKVSSVILIPLAWLVYVVCARVALELVLAVFRILALAEASRPKPPAAPTAGEPAGGLL